MATNSLSIPQLLALFQIEEVPYIPVWYELSWDGMLAAQRSAAAAGNKATVMIINHLDLIATTNVQVETALKTELDNWIAIKDRYARLTPKAGGIAGLPGAEYNVDEVKLGIEKRIRDTYVPFWKAHIQIQKQIESAVVHDADNIPFY